MSLFIDNKTKFSKLKKIARILDMPSLVDTMLSSVKEIYYTPFQTNAWISTIDRKSKLQENLLVVDKALLIYPFLTRLVTIVGLRLHFNRFANKKAFTSGIFFLDMWYSTLPVGPTESLT
jgi:hypothetical protein